MVTNGDGKVSETSANQGHISTSGSDVDPVMLEALKIIDRGRTLRTIVVCLSVIIGIALIVYGVIKVVDKPPWLTLCLAIVVALVGPSGVISVLIKSRQKYVNKTHMRTVELEKGLDENRTSSRGAGKTVDDRENGQ